MCYEKVSDGSLYACGDGIVYMLRPEGVSVFCRLVAASTAHNSGLPSSRRGWSPMDRMHAYPKHLIKCASGFYPVSADILQFAERV